MQQLQEETKKDIIKHATRSIEIIYESGKTIMTKEDEEFLAAYISLHDFEWQMQKIAEKLYHESVPVNSTIEELEAELKSLQAKLNHCRSMADKLSNDSYVPDEASLEKLKESQAKISIAMASYHDKLLKAYQIIEAIAQETENYNRMKEEEEDVLYNRYAEICVTHNMNWEINAINIVNFEDEYERFINYKSLQEDRLTTLMEFCDSTLKNYTNLNLKTTALYNVWEEFIKRCTLLRKAAELHTRAILFSNN